MDEQEPGTRKQTDKGHREFNQFCPLDKGQMRTMLGDSKNTRKEVCRVSFDRVLLQRVPEAALEGTQTSLQAACFLMWVGFCKELAEMLFKYSGANN